MSKPKLLVLTSTFPRWADDHEPPFVYELARRLTGFFDVTVLAPHASGALRQEEMDGVHVERFRYAPDALEKLAYDGGIPVRLRRHRWLALLVPFFLASQQIACIRLMRRLRPAAVHAHWLLPQGLTAVLARWLSGQSPRLLVTAHGADLHGLNSQLARHLKRLVLTQADAVSVASSAMAQQAAELVHRADEITVAPMGVDLQHVFTPSPERPVTPVLVFAGRLVEKKGGASLLEAMPKVLSRFPETRLLVAGHGPLRAMLLARAQALGVADNVEFLGAYRNAELPDIFRQGSMAVLPFLIAADGDQEGLGLVTVEAMGCGLPVVAGDVPAVRDVVTNECTGLLVDASDIAALAGQIIRLLADPALATRLARNGRAAATAHFDWVTVAARYAGLLDPRYQHGTAPDHTP